jgi:hypothetical protein
MCPLSYLFPPIHYSPNHGLIYAFNPIVIGLPSTSAVVTVFPRVLATTKVLPDDEGVGFSKSISMQSFLPLISTIIAMMWFSFCRFNNAAISEQPRQLHDHKIIMLTIKSHCNQHSKLYTGLKPKGWWPFTQGLGPWQCLSRR